MNEAYKCTNILKERNILIGDPNAVMSNTLKVSDLYTIILSLVNNKLWQTSGKFLKPIYSRSAISVISFTNLLFNYSIQFYDATPNMIARKELKNTQHPPITYHSFNDLYRAYESYYHTFEKYNDIGYLRILYENLKKQEFDDTFNKIRKNAKLAANAIDTWRIIGIRKLNLPATLNAINSNPGEYEILFQVQEGLTLTLRFFGNDTITVCRLADDYLEVKDKIEPLGVCENNAPYQGIQLKTFISKMVLPLIEKKTWVNRSTPEVLNVNAKEDKYGIKIYRILNVKPFDNTIENKIIRIETVPEVYGLYQVTITEKPYNSSSTKKIKLLMYDDEKLLIGVCLPK